MTLRGGGVRALQSIKEFVYILLVQHRDVGRPTLLSNWLPICVDRRLKPIVRVRVAETRLVT